MRQNEITTIPDLIVRCGGLKATANTLKTTPQHLVNWRAVGKIPPAHYKLHRKRLLDKRIAVSDALWGFHAEAAE